MGADSTERVSTSGYHATTYTYNALGLGTEKDSLGNIIAYTRDNKGNLVSERTSSDSYHYLFDGLGSVVGLMDVNNNLFDSYVYDPYGVTEHQTGSQYNPYQFAGGYFDSYTLYYKFGTRYYDRFGRWTPQDSQPSTNPYVYANDDPVNETDPSGQYTVGPIFGVVEFGGLPITFIPIGIYVDITQLDIPRQGDEPGLLLALAGLLSTLFLPTSVSLSISALGLGVTYGVGEAVAYSHVNCNGGTVRVEIYFNAPTVPNLSCI